MSRAQYWGEQIFKEAEEIKEKLLKSARGEGATRGVDSVVRAWPQRQHLQRLYARLLTKAIRFGLTSRVEQDLWNVVFREPINTLQSSQRSTVAEHRRQAHVQLSMLVDSATGFYAQLLNALCTTYAIELPARHSQVFYGIIQNYVDFGKQHPCRTHPVTLVGPATSGTLSEHKASAERAAAAASEDSSSASVNASVNANASKTSASASSSASSEPSRAQLLALCHYCLIHLGDLARYGENMVHAQDFYQLAADLLPSDGHAFNQLAIVQTQLFGEAKSLASLEASQLSPGAVLSLRRLLCGLALSATSSFSSSEQYQQQNGLLEAGTLHALVCEARNECTLGALNALSTLFLYAKSLAVRTPFTPAIHNLTALFRAQLSSGNESLYGLRLGDHVNAHLYLVAKLFLCRDAPRDLQRLADRVLPKFGKLLEPRSPLTSSSSAKTSGNTGNKSRAVQRQQPTAAAPAASSEEDTLWPGEGQQGTMVLKMVMLLVFVLERLAMRTGEQPASASGSAAPPTAAATGNASSSTSSAAGGDPTADSASLLEEDPAPRPTPLLVTDPSKASYFEVALRYFCGIFERLVSSTLASAASNDLPSTKYGSLDQSISMPALSLVLQWLHLHEELLFGPSSAPLAANPASSAASEPSLDPQGASLSEGLFLKQAALWHNMAALLTDVVERARKPRDDDYDYDVSSYGAHVLSSARGLLRPKRAPLPEESLVRGFLVLHSQFSDEDAAIDFTLGPLDSVEAATDERCRLLIRFGRWLAFRCDTLARPHLAFDPETNEFSSDLPVEDSSQPAPRTTPSGNNSHSNVSNKADRHNAVLQTISSDGSGGNQLGTQSSNSFLPPTSAAGVIMNDPAIIAALSTGRRGSSDSGEAASAGSKGNSSYPRNLPPRLKRMAHSAGVAPASSTPPPALSGSLERPLERPQATSTPPPGSIVSSALQGSSSGVPPRLRTNLNSGASLLGMPNLLPTSAELVAVSVGAADRALLEGQPLVAQDTSAVVASQQEKLSAAPQAEVLAPRLKGLLAQHQVPSMLAQPFVPAAMRAQLQAGQMPLIAPAMTFSALVVPVPIVPIPMRPIPHPATVTGAPLVQQSTGSLAAINSASLRGSPGTASDGVVDMSDSHKSTAAVAISTIFGDSSASSSAFSLAPSGATANVAQQRTSPAGLANAQRWGQLVAHRKTDSLVTPPKSSPLVDLEVAGRYKLVSVTQDTVLSTVDQASLASRRSAANEVSNPAGGLRQLQATDTTSSEAAMPTAGDLISSLFGREIEQQTQNSPAVAVSASSSSSSTVPASAVSAPASASHANLIAATVLRSSDKLNASNTFPAFNSFDTWKNFEPRSSAQTVAVSSKSTNGVSLNGGANVDSKDATVTANTIRTSGTSSSWRLNPDVEPFQFHGSLQKPAATMSTPAEVTTEAPDLNSILGSIIESPAIIDSPKYPFFSSNGNGPHALTTTTASWGARVGGKGSAPGSGRPLYESPSDVPGSWDLWRNSREQPIGFGGGFSSWSTSDELHSNSAWRSEIGRESTSGSSKPWSRVSEETATQEDGSGLFGNGLWGGERSMLGLGHSNGDDSTLKLTGIDLRIESRTGERLETDTGASIPSWSGRFK